MANVYIGARSPKGSVGVRGVVDSGELSAYSAGTLSGFAGNSVLSWTISVGGVTGTQDVAIAKNPGGESELLVGTVGQSIDFIIGGAPGTPGQSRTDALVIYKDPFATSLVNDGIDTVDYEVVAGTAAATGSQVPPDDTAIRAAIPTGSLKFVAVIGYVTIAYGQSSVSLGNYTRNLAQFNSLLIPRFTGTRRRLGSNKGSDTAAGGVTTSYVTYATLTATSYGGLCVIDVSGLFQNAASGAARTYDYRVQCDGVTVDAAVTGTVIPFVSGQTTATTSRDLFTHTPAAGSHTWTFQALASAVSSVTLRKPIIQVDEINA